MFGIALQDNIRCHRYETLEKDHGRIEKRTYTTLPASEVFDEGEYSQWQGLRSLIQVEREISNSEGETRIDRAVLYQQFTTRRLSVNRAIYSRALGN